MSSCQFNTSYNRGATPRHEHLTNQDSFDIENCSAASLDNLEVSQFVLNQDDEDASSDMEITKRIDKTISHQAAPMSTK